MSNVTHDDLVIRAEKWLITQGCNVTMRDHCHIKAENGEMPDAIGWKQGKRKKNTSILIECKVSRSDFLVDKKKKFRAEPELGIGEWRFYMCPPDVIKVEDLPDKWGLLYATDKTIQQIYGVPKGKRYGVFKPFRKYNYKAQETLLIAAARRMIPRGHFNDIYSGIPEGIETRKSKAKKRKTRMGHT